MKHPKTRFCTYGATLALTAILLTVPAVAGPGHDHGDHAGATPAAATPRFSAASDAFELVGILENKLITLYLDKADTNAPVTDAHITVELRGKSETVTPAKDGHYQIALAEPLPGGVAALVATITYRDQTDLLTAEIDVHLAAQKSPTAQRHFEPSRTTIASAAALTLALLAGAWVWLRSKGGHRSALTGGVK